MSFELGSPRALLFLVALLALSEAASTRAKRQISPAQQLQEYLDSYARFTREARSVSPSHDLFSEIPSNYRDLLSAGKRTLSPSAEIDANTMQLRALYGIGKRSLHIAPSFSEFSELGDLAAVGKRHIAPSSFSQELPSDARLSQLAHIGKRSSNPLSPSLFMDTPDAALLDVGKRSGNSVSPSMFNETPEDRLARIGKRATHPVSSTFLIPDAARLGGIGKRSAASPAMNLQEMNDVYSSLYEIGRKRGSIAPSADLEQQIQLQRFLGGAGR